MKREQFPVSAHTAVYGRCWSCYSKTSRKNISLYHIYTVTLYIYILKFGVYPYMIVRRIRITLYHVYNTCQHVWLRNATTTLRSRPSTIVGENVPTKI